MSRHSMLDPGDCEDRFKKFWPFLVYRMKRLDLMGSTLSVCDRLKDCAEQSGEIRFLG